MTTAAQRSAARTNIRAATAAARSKKTIAHLPARVRTALGKRGNAVKRQRARAR